MTFLSTSLAGLIVLISSYTVYSSWCLLQNYRKARRLGFHVIVSPISLLNPVWILTSPIFLPWLEKLPASVFYYFKFISFDWVYREKYSIHEKHGDAICIVNPAWVQLYVADAAAIEDIAIRRKDFVQPEEIYSNLNFFGVNVDSAEGATWQRHRKLTAPPFNERNSSLVWSESLRQASQMVSTWLDSTEAVHNTSADTMILALHVLTRAGFGQAYAFDTGIKVVPSGHTLSYKDSLVTLLKSFPLLVMFNHDLLRKSYMPKTLRDLGLAIQEFKQYMMEMIEREREKMALRESGSSIDIESENLVTSLIRASEDGKAANYSLTDDEIMGNLFIYNLAGHETTANTLAYTLFILSVNPKTQDWLHNEIERVLGDAGPLESWKYEDVFPHLKRCLAAMYETLRFYGPVPDLKRCVKDAPQTLNIGGKQHVIPPDTVVVMNNAANQTQPKYWGNDSLEWKPQRWIDDELREKDGGETFKKPPVKGCYMPWFDSSPRVCPGKKFSQVEFVAVIALLLKDHAVSVKLEEGETLEQAKERVMDVVNDSKVNITLQMKRPETVHLIWKKR